MSVNFKTSELNKTSPDKIYFQEYFQVYKQAVGKFDLKCLVTLEVTGSRATGPTSLA
jgi:hypothetical protein